MFVNKHIFVVPDCYFIPMSSKQVEATTGRRAEVRRRNGLFSQDTKRPGKTARPALTGPLISSYCYSKL